MSQNLNSSCVAIIGRPNVGKSTLFNVLIGSRKALVKNTPGVTRDIQYESTELWGKSFDLIDTGGITDSEDQFSKLIKDQVFDLIETIDILLVVCDAKAGLCPEDREVVQLAQESGKPYLVIVNKADRVSDEDLVLSDFYQLGCQMVAASFEQRRGLSEILEWLNDHLPEQIEPEKTSTCRLAIVGKPNVGKSSLCNQILGKNRMIVSKVAGTTTDSIDLPIEVNGESFVLVDTAGIRRPVKRSTGVEWLSVVKAQKSIKKADLVLLLIDGTQGPSDQDSKILSKISESHKAVILVINKSDLGKVSIPEYRKTLREQVGENFHYFESIPVCFVSAKTGAGIGVLFNKIVEIKNKMQIRISTGQINDFFFNVIRKAPAPIYGTKTVKFFYITQTRQVPPSFIAFANYPQGVLPSYRRFLVKQIAQNWKLQEIPIRVFVMKSRGK